MIIKKFTSSVGSSILVVKSTEKVVVAATEEATTAADVYDKMTWVFTSI